MAFVFVDVEAHFDSPCPGVGGGMTEFGAVELESGATFHGELTGEDETWFRVMSNFASWLNQFEKRLTFVSDNPAYDWQWINYHFHHCLGYNPFGFSARRIGDFYAGLVDNWYETQKWKRLRITEHDHNPVHDAQGNVEAFKRLLNGER